MPFEVRKIGIDIDHKTPRISSKKKKKQISSKKPMKPNQVM